MRNSLGREQIGQRLSVRSLTGGQGPSGGPEATDTIGVLVAVEADSVVLERRDGSRTKLRTDRIVAARIVPLRPRRRQPAVAIDADALTRITSRGWPAVVSEPLGDWELRAAGGFTGRANSAAVHGDPGVELSEALSAVVRFAERHRIAPRAQVVLGSLWERRFAAAGWERTDGPRPGAIVQVADIGAVAADRDIEFASTASDAWLSRYGRVEDPTTARAVLEGPDRVAFATLDEVAIARVVVTGTWAGLTALEVEPGHRRRGLARRLVLGCLAWAAERGADKAYLQVMEDNAPALALYAPLGFTTHHAYAYLRPPS
ncbi:GNAT family N-acetyltransferase [Aeromicrobium sp. YIM 150415]|uniref:GNAT family N-acetyltransferase n=1 Tax=Aeromicrobium sp. YIM 150415 TaxID=2803912 RepID=UPI001963D452|nr:GNAT family N-acetyltransferase [Aeromicrobium sp. YIM 150415]MBM9465619.1 GNAT family N-acetyltransferase [Aeromicrobium sp. YIM 150415]